MSSKNTGSDTESAESSHPDQDMSEAKAKMRAALERKNAGDHPTAEGVRNTGPVHGNAVGGEGKRTFQPRKTG